MANAGLMPQRSRSLVMVTKRLTFFARRNGSAMAGIWDVSFVSKTMNPALTHISIALLVARDKEST